MLLTTTTENVTNGSDSNLLFIKQIVLDWIG